MRYCGYCDIETEKPCHTSELAMTCSQDFNDAGIKVKKVVDTTFQIEAEADYVIQKRFELERKTKEQLEGIKFDDNKPRMDLIPPELNVAVATILKFGAKKYSDRNWEKGMSWGRVFSALMRHMWAWWNRSHMDKESGYSHLWHAACCLAFLIAYEQRGTGTDDRYNPKENK